MNRLVLAALIVATGGAPLTGIASPQTCAWTGNGGNALWSTDGNWTCIAVSPHGHPQNGDDVGFAANSPQPTNTNDLSQLVIRHLILNRRDLLVTGNPVSLTNGVEGNPSGASGTDHGPHFGLAIKLAAGGQTFENTGGAVMQLDGPLDLNTHDLTVTSTTGLNLNGAIGGAGSIAKTGNGFVDFEGNNTYAGNTVITDGTLVTGSTGLGAAAGGGNATFVANGGTLLMSAVGESLAESPSLDGNGNSDLGALIVAGDGNVMTSGIFLPGAGAAISVLVADTTFTITAPISGDGILKKFGIGTLRLDSRRCPPSR
jgi:autotransporter-associated beta strand protein